MQQRFGTLYTLLQKWDEQLSLSKGYCYVPAIKGFSAIDKMSNDYKIRPRFER
jgi:hypothetical protein